MGAHLAEGSGKAGTAVTYDYAFDNLPALAIGLYGSGASGKYAYISAHSKTGHTVTANSGTPYYWWIAMDQQE
jgi:hypothetical protein